MRVFVPTSNDYIWYCEATCKLLEKYWPCHPPVDVCHFEKRPKVPAGFSRLDFQFQASCRKWVDQFIRYLSASREELILLILDDYALFQRPNHEAIDRSASLLRTQPSICGVALTWQPCNKEPLAAYDCQFVAFPKWAYTINLQAGLWRRSDLLTILSRAAPTCGPWDFEQSASHWFHQHLWDKGYRIAGWNCPEPPNPSGFVDCVDKSGWALAYHNLCRRRKRDARHDGFLRAEGLLP